MGWAWVLVAHTSLLAALWLYAEGRGWHAFRRPHGGERGAAM